MKIRLIFLFIGIIGRVSTQTLIGTITDEAGAPVPNARVTLFNVDTSWFWETRTAADGKYSFENLPGGGPYLFFGVAKPGKAYFQNATTGIIGTVVHDAVLAPEDNTGQWDVILQSPEALGGTNSAAMLPDGKIMFCHSTKDPFRFDPATNDTLVTKGDTKIQGCHAVRLLLDGRLLYAGGTDQEIYGPGIKKIKTFDPVNQTWQPLPDMKDFRWYPTLAPLPDGRLLIVGGGNLQNPQRTRSAEIYNLATLSSALTDSLPIGNEVSPIVLLHNGKVLMTHRPPQLFDPVTETWSLAGDFVQGPRMPNGDHADHELTLLANGKVTAIGYKSFIPDNFGNIVELYDPASNTWSLGENFLPVRSRCKSVLLPDEKILILGGYKEDPADPIPTNQYGYMKLADLYDPYTGSWRRLASMNYYREYHTNSMLVPDGRVVTVGGEGAPGNEPPFSILEAFKPPYLFRGIRPEIHNLPKTDWQRGETLHFDLKKTESPTRIVLMSFVAVTHFMNSGNNRFLDLPFTFDGAAVDAHIPADSVLAMPGYYLLFVLVDDIPSVAKIVRIVPGQVSVAAKSPVFEPGISVFPNPAHREIFLQTELAIGERVRSVSLRDVSGRLIQRWPGGITPETDGRMRLGIPDCPAGTYFLNVETGNRTITKKVVLQK